jgi:hypothetical protein
MPQNIDAGLVAFFNRLLEPAMVMDGINPTDLEALKKLIDKNPVYFIDQNADACFDPQKIFRGCTNAKGQPVSLDEQIDIAINRPITLAAGAMPTGLDQTFGNTNVTYEDIMAAFFGRENVPVFLGNPDGLTNALDTLTNNHNQQMQQQQTGSNPQPTGLKAKVGGVMQQSLMVVPNSIENTANVIEGARDFTKSLGGTLFKGTALLAGIAIAAPVLGAIGIGSAVTMGGLGATSWAMAGALAPVWINTTLTGVGLDLANVVGKGLDGAVKKVTGGTNKGVRAAADYMEEVMNTAAERGLDPKMLFQLAQQPRMA